MFGLGCFWGAERKFWQPPGVYATAVGYAGRLHANPTYEEVCSGRTGHGEVVRSSSIPKLTSYEELLKTVLGEPRSDPGHAPGQRRRHAVPLRHLHVRRRAAARRRGVEGSLRKELRAAATARSRRRSSPRRQFYYAEDYHQQYLGEEPARLLRLGGTGVSCPIGLGNTNSLAQGSGGKLAPFAADASELAPGKAVMEILEAHRRNRGRT